MNKQIYYRLIALWIICEAMAGGIIRSFKLPFSGIILASSSLICISLIAFHARQRGYIIKAMIIVGVFKLMLTPQISPMAYFALFFQGFLGELVFLDGKFRKFSCLLLGVVALIETGTQRIAVMTFLFGIDMWESINLFFNTVFISVNYSLIIIISYLSVHIIAGAAVGLLAWNLPGIIEKRQQKTTKYIFENPEIIYSDKAKNQKKPRSTKILLLICILLILLHNMPGHICAQIFIRSLSIALTWYFFVSPLLMNFLKRSLKKQKMAFHQDINEIIHIMPKIKSLMIISWQQSVEFKNWRRIRHFFTTVVVNILYVGPEKLDKSY